MNEPLLERQTDGAIRPVVHSMHVFDFLPSVFLAPRFQMGFHLSLASPRIEGQESSARLSDSRLMLKYRTSGDAARTAFATQADVTVPTGNEHYFLSTGGVGWSLREAVERRFGALRATLNLGLRYQPRGRWREVDYRKQWLGGLGGEITLSKRFALNAEMLGYVSIPFRSGNSAAEYYLGGRYAFSESGALLGGMSHGGFGGESNDSYRVIVGFQFRSVKRKPRVVFNPRPVKCGVEPFTATYFSRRLRPEEVRNLGPLPYRSDVDVPTKSGMSRLKTLQLGEMTGATPAGFPYVENSQVPFAIELSNLPARSKVKRVDQALLKMAVKKLSRDPYLGTEILCFVDHKTCSGSVITHPEWAKAVNWGYFPHQKAANGLYGRQYLGRSVGEVNGRRVYSAELSMELSDLLEGSQVRPLDVLYSKRVEGASSWPVLLVAGDDTFVSNDVKLELVLSVEVCR